MITREYGKQFGVCDLCDEETPRFKWWAEVNEYMRNNRWRAVKDPDSGEWEHYCPVCNQRMKNHKNNK